MLVFRALNWSIIRLVLLIGECLAVDYVYHIHDASFDRFCKIVGSETIKVNDENTPMSDTCEMTWRQFPASSDEEAMLYCKTWGPYHVAEARRSLDGRTWCKYQNLYSCYDDYIQIHGYCYKKTTDVAQNYKEAKAICRKEHEAKKVGVSHQFDIYPIKLHDVDLIRLIEAFFANNTQFIVEPNEALDEYVEFDEGVSKSDKNSKYIVVLDASMHYDLGQGAIIRLPGNTRFRIPLQVFCYYQPADNALSFGVKAKMLEPYYYKIDVAGSMTAWRTSSHYSSYIGKDDWMTHHFTCSKSVKAIARNGGDLWDAKRENVALLTNQMKQQFVISSTPYFHCCFSWNDLNGNYHYVEELVYNPSYLAKHSFFCHSYPTLGDRHSWSKTKVGCEGHGGNAKVKTTSSLLFTPEKVGDHDIIEVKIARDAPLLCSVFLIHRPTIRPTLCFDGWRKYVRKNGNGGTFCVKSFLEKAVTHKKAASHCLQFHAHLIVFVDQEEVDYIHQQNLPIWIGAKKRKECTQMTTSGKCSKTNLFVWDNNNGDGSYSGRNALAAQLGEHVVDHKDYNCIIYSPINKLYNYLCDSEAYVMCISGLQRMEY